MRISTILSLIIAAGTALAVFDANSKTNVVLYWGQNSRGLETSQDRLGHYCESSDVDVILLSFLIQFNGPGGQPVMDFANQGMAQPGESVKCSLFTGTGLFRCPEIEKDIQKCQNQDHKTILLSIGGATYTEGGFSSEKAAIDMANKMWAIFGPQQESKPDSSILRPFGKAGVDGFDFDFESTANNVVPFAKRLRELMNESSKASGSRRKSFLSAAPQCTMPDYWNTELLSKVPLDMVLVQFYNNYCGVNTFVPGTDTQPSYNFGAWDTWARTVSPNKSVKILMGVPGNTKATQTGYTPFDKLKPAIEHSKKFGSFGGVMIWDASQAWVNGDFTGEIKRKLKEGGAR